jgi:hypothetical protein
MHHFLYRHALARSDIFDCFARRSPHTPIKPISKIIWKVSVYSGKPTIGEEFTAHTAMHICINVINRAHKVPDISV